MLSWIALAVQGSLLAVSWQASRFHRYDIALATALFSVPLGVLALVSTWAL
jgi:hypothetical protein